MAYRGCVLMKNPRRKGEIKNKKEMELKPKLELGSKTRKENNHRRKREELMRRQKKNIETLINLKKYSIEKFKFMLFSD